MSAIDAAAAMLASTGLMRRFPGRGPLLLMFHGLGLADGLDPNVFEIALDLLGARRRIVPLGDAVDALGRPESNELAAITFDDGYRDFAELAVPRLAQRSLHATLFVPSARLGGTNAWDRAVALERRILDGSELRALEPAVVEIGAHGAQHRRLVALDGEALREETTEARKHLEDVTGRKVRLFAYPYGQLDDFDLAAERAVEAAGFVAACSTHFGRGSKPEERYRLRRIGLGPGDDADTIARKLDGAYDFLAPKEKLGRTLRRWRSR